MWELFKTYWDVLGCTQFLPILHVHNFYLYYIAITSFTFLLYTNLQLYLINCASIYSCLIFVLVCKLTVSLFTTPLPDPSILPGKLL